MKRTWLRFISWIRMKLETGLKGKRSSYRINFYLNQNRKAHWKTQKGKSPLQKPRWCRATNPPRSSKKNNQKKQLNKYREENNNKHSKILLWREWTPHHKLKTFPKKIMAQILIALGMMWKGENQLVFSVEWALILKKLTAIMKMEI